VVPGSIPNIICAFLFISVKIRCLEAIFQSRVVIRSLQ
jgi:hypothetical protein